MIKFTKPSSENALAIILVVGGFIGMLSSFVLTVEKFNLLKDSSFVPACNINPVFSCTSVSNMAQSEVFGFPNMLIGVPAFAMVVAVGMAILAGAQFKKWFWQLFTIGTFGGFIFIQWFIIQSLYSIGALCIYCMSVWAITMPIFWYTLLFVLENNFIPTPKKLQSLANIYKNNHAMILLAWYIGVFFLIIQRFWDFFSSSF